MSGIKAELIFLNKGEMGLKGISCNKYYTEYEVPSGCSPVYFRRKTRILVINTTV
jgi:hypothetical protein